MSTRSAITAVVIGAGIAGLVTARVLSGHFDRVLILERERLPDGVTTRRCVPQGQHAHVLLGAGQHLLNGWFPGLAAELEQQGAVPTQTRDMLWHQAGGYRRQPDFGVSVLSMSRPLLETTIRKRLLRHWTNVALRDGVSVDGLIVQSDRVVGVRVGHEEHRADLVVACSGRNTRFLDQLATMGFPAPAISAIRIDMAYGTRVVRRSPAERDRTLAVAVAGPARGHRVGSMVPVEGDRWIITVGAFHGEVPPTEPAEYEDFARSLPSPALAEALARSEDHGPALTHRMPTSRRRHVERLKQAPTGFLVLGDAICSFNPIYGQGMTSAALQARALGQVIERHGPTAATVVPAFYRQAARVVDGPWRIAARGDFADPRTSGPKPAGTDLVNRYLAKVFQACHTSLPVARQTMRVQNLLARPESLMTPAMILRVLLAARRSPAAGPQRH